MIVTCPSCASDYALPNESIPPAGRGVRCAACRTTWRVERPAPVLAEATEGSGAESVPAEDDRADAVIAGAARISPAESSSAEIPPAESSPAESSPAESSPVDLDALRGVAPDVDAPRGEGLVIDAVARPAPDGAAPALVRPRRPLLRRGASPRPRGVRVPRVAVLSLLLLALPAALIGGRAAVVRALPGAAPLYAAAGLPVNLRGVAITEVTGRVVSDDGAPLLVVEGRLTNVSRHRVELGRLRLAVRADNGVEVYAWTAPPERAALEPGEGIAFRRRLAAPPPEGREVQVRFARPDDAGPGGARAVALGSSG